MGERRAWRSFAVVAVLVGACSAATIMSCGGGGGGGSSNGGLCEQCGDTDGPCNINGENLTSDQTQPAFCPNRDGTNGVTCHVELICTRKLDSAQRRCFPADDHGALDLRYECDGSRPQATPVQTSTPVETAIATASPVATVSPTSTAPTPTGVTPSPSPTATPAATSTPAPEDVLVDIDLSTDSTATNRFTVTVTYQSSKGTFGGGAVTCTGDADGVTANDSGSALTLQIPANPDSVDSNTITCPFHQRAGAELMDNDLSASSSDPTITAVASVE